MEITKPDREILVNLNSRTRLKSGEDEKELGVIVVVLDTNLEAAAKNSSFGFVYAARHLQGGGVGRRRETSMLSSSRRQGLEWRRTEADVRATLRDLSVVIESRRRRSSRLRGLDRRRKSVRPGLRRRRERGEEQI
ncbi:hypothetical protein ACLB2K_050334 [Fragaria x ananassa]